MRRSRNALSYRIAVRLSQPALQSRCSPAHVAGIFAMPFWRFQFANFTSAFLWAAVLPWLGGVTTKLIKYFWS